MERRARARRPRSNCGQRITIHLLAHLAHEVGEGVEGDQLAGGEEVAEGCEAILYCPEIAWIVRQRRLRHPVWLGLPSDCLMLRRGFQVDTSTIALGDDGHQACAHAPGHPFCLNIVWRNRRIRHDAAKVRPTGQLGATLRPFCILGLANAHGEAIAVALNHRLDIRLSARPSREHKGRGEGHIDVGKGGVRALHGTRPEPSDHRELPAEVGLKVGAIVYHLCGNLNPGVEVPNAPLGLIAHPLAIVADVLGQALSPAPNLFHCRGRGGTQRVLNIRSSTLLCVRCGKTHRRHARKLGWDLDHGLVDQHRHGVQIASVALQPEALGLKGQGTATGERVMESGELIRVEQLGSARVIFVIGAGTAPTLPNLIASLLEQSFIRRILPQHQLLNQAKEALPLLGLRLLGREELRMGGGIIDQLGKDHGAGGGQGATRPPEVQRTGVTVADRLLTRTGLVDLLQGQGDLNELFGSGHGKPQAARSDLIRRRTQATKDSAVSVSGLR